MPENPSVWGIDIGQAGLKAIQLRYAEGAGQVIAVGFDYIPHAKILSQPDAIPGELIAEALNTFFARNEKALKGAKIAIATPANSSIVKFIQLPPVDSSKVGDIVKYEAKQQIPFDLNDVVWDWQTMGGGSEEGGLLLDAEIGLIAMKKEQVANAMKPYTERKIEIEAIQTTQMALYNCLAYDQFGQRPENPLEELETHTVLLDMGADGTTMLVSNGKKIWQRNISIGGNQFTRALTKEMKLTFAKAEHLKCNATKAPDPKAVFQALRPVFNDYVSEIQRSIGFFSSVNREAKITKILAVGNGFKLAGLQKFLQQNLQYDVERMEVFQGLVGDAVLSQPLFQENAMSFAVPYGLALQLLDRTVIKTSLLPQEIRVRRIIRQKKPWAVATAASLLMGLSMSTMGFAYVHSTVAPDRWKNSEEAVKGLQQTAGTLKTDYDGAKKKNEELRKEGDFLVSPAKGRQTWLEVYKAINACLPWDDAQTVDEIDPNKKPRIRLWSITCKLEPDLEAWFKATSTAQPAALNYIDPEDKATPPKGSGYVFTLKGLHYYEKKDEFLYLDEVKNNQLRKAFLNNLKEWEVVEMGENGPILPPVPVRKIGITHAMLMWSQATKKEFYPSGPPTGAGPAGVMTKGTPPGLPGAPPRTLASGPPGMPPGMMPGMGRRPGTNRNRKTSTTTNPTEPASPLQEKIDVWQTNFEIVLVWKNVPEELRLPVRPVVAAPGAAPGVPGTPPAPGMPPVNPAMHTAPGAPPGTPGTPPMPTPNPAMHAAPGTTPPGMPPANNTVPTTIPPGTVPPGTPPMGTTPPPVAPGTTPPAAPM